MSNDLPLLDYVLAELEARKGTWPRIARQMSPDSADSYYSWMSKLTQDGAINDPGVKKIQALADYFRANPREEQAA
jgi:hypothetical protein